MCFTRYFAFFFTAKAESERQRLLRDLQKEIKQLYHDLNERTQQLEVANAKIKVCFTKNCLKVQGLEDIIRTDRRPCMCSEVIVI